MSASLAFQTLPTEKRYIFRDIIKSVSHTLPKQRGELYRRLGESCWNSPSHWSKYTLSCEKRQEKSSRERRFGQEIYKENWERIKDDIWDMMNQMFMERNVTIQQKQGMIVCLPKLSEQTTSADFRPITLLNTDYKILALSSHTD